MASVGVVKWLSRPADYRSTWQAMQAFTHDRLPGAPDEIWLCEHPPVYTLGQAGRPEHVLLDNGIELIQTDRGGQVTYHGPGQLLAYALVDLRRAGLFVRDYVRLIEDAVLDTLLDLGVPGGCRVAGAPGVYVDDGQGTPAKIAALGVKIRQGCSYHGVALNVDMDLSPYDAINPCGYPGLRTIDIRRLGVVSCDIEQIGELLGAHLISRLDAAVRATPPLA